MTSSRPSASYEHYERHVVEFSSQNRGSVSLLLAAVVSAYAQTDVSASVVGGFTRSSVGNGVIQTPSAHIGGIAEVRHIWHPLVGLDVNYTYLRANQVFNLTDVKANANEFGASWVVSLPVLILRPFVLGGIGGTYFHPDSDQPDVASKTELTYIYGGGLDITLIPHFGLRLQYRGNIYKAPNMLTTVLSTGVYTHTAEPMAGLYLKF